MKVLVACNEDIAIFAYMAAQRVNVAPVVPPNFIEVFLVLSLAPVAPVVVPGKRLIGKKDSVDGCFAIQRLGTAPQ